MRAAVYKSPETIEVEEVPEPKAEAGQALVDIAQCGICGSDLHCYHGGLGVQEGQIMGHEFCGTVVEAPGVEGIDPGMRVTVRPLTPCMRCRACLSGEYHLCGAGHALNIGYGTPGAFADKVLVPRAIPGLTIFPLPDSIDDDAGALIEPLSVGLRAARLARPQPADVAVVTGLGTIGMGAVAWLRMLGAMTVIAADPSPRRREVAAKLGADITVDPMAASLADEVAKVTGPGGYGMGAAADVVVECSGAPPAFADLLKSVRHGGRMIVAAMYSDKVTVRPDRFVEKELEIHGSFAYKDEFPRVIKLLDRGAIDPTILISGTFGLDSVGDAFKAQLDRETSLKVLVAP